MREPLPDAAMVWTEDEAREVLDAWRRSGESLAAFARRHRLTAQRLYWWRSRLSSPPSPKSAAVVSFVPATVIDPEPAADGAGIVIRLPSGVAIEIAHASPAWLAAIVSELARSS
jgi:hypothetical protein